MKVTKDKVENSQAFLTVEMEPGEMEGSMEASYRRLVQKVNVPGFRKGKTPRDVLERHVGREGIVEEAIKQLVPDAYGKAIKEQAIEPFAHPEINITQTDPLIFKAVVPLMPSVELGDYHSIRMALEPVNITEENVDKVIEELRHQHATWDAVERPAGNNDLITINIDSTAEDKPFIKRVGVQYQIKPDSDVPVPGFAEQLVGLNKGEEKEFKLRLPDDFGRAELAGKEASFKVKVEEVKEEKLPEIEELAKKISPQAPTTEELRQEISKSLQTEAENRAKISFEGRLIGATVEGSKVEYPPVMLEMELDRLIEDSARQLQMNGRSLDDYLKSVNKTPAQLRDDLRPVAEKNVSSSLVLGYVAEAEKMAVDAADIDAEIENMIADTADPRKEEIKKMLNAPPTRESIRQSLMTKKTIERLTEIAQSAETVVTGEKEDKNNE